jgi:hypothetical protein
MAHLQDREYINFDSQDYDFLISFNNGEKEISLNSQSLIELQVVENFLNWYMEGYVIIDNPYDQFERLGKLDESIISSDEIDYKYRGDGRDIITIRIIPRIDSVSTMDGLGGSPPDLKTEIWEIYMEGVIYDVEDLPSDSSQVKRKKFYFWEKEYHALLEKNIEFTTSNVGENLGATEIHKKSNWERSLKTGEALLEVFKAVEELKPKVPESVGELWAEGDEKNKIFYTSPSNYKAIDDVNYILSQHTNSEEDGFDLCFLKFNRRLRGEPKKFTFESLSKYFEKAGTGSAGEYQTEKFIILDMAESFGGNIPIPKTPQDSPTFERNIMSLGRNEINSYQFVEMGGLDSSQLIQIFPIHTYHTVKGQFNIHIDDNTPQKAKDFQTEYYLSKIGPNSKPRLHLNQWKTNGYNLTNLWGHGGKESRYADGRNKILMSSLLNGTTISFSVVGQTSRQTGRFISIDRAKYNDNDFDDRLEGQYFTMTVSHNFQFKSQEYRNTIIATKLHRYNSVNSTPEEETLLT